MKRNLLIFSTLLGVWTMSAKPNSMVELSTGGEWRKSNTYGIDVHVGYGLMFNPYVGLGLGIDFARNSSTQKQDSLLQSKIKDSEGESYNHLTLMTNWKTQQIIYSLEIPISIYLRAPLGNDKTWLFSSIGAKVGIPIQGQVNNSGIQTQTGDYTQWNMVVTDVKGHGFYTEEVHISSVIHPKVYYAAFIKVGIETALDKNKQLNFFTHAFTNYYFVKNDNALPISIGLEIGLRYRFSHTQPYSCRCIRN